MFAIKLGLVRCEASIATIKSFESGIDFDCWHSTFQNKYYSEIHTLSARSSYPSTSFSNPMHYLVLFSKPVDSINFD